MKQWSENILCRIQGGFGPGANNAPGARSNGYLSWALTPTANEKSSVKTARLNAAKYFLQMEDYINQNLSSVDTKKRIETLKNIEYGMDYYGKQINKAVGTAPWTTSAEKCGITADKGDCGEPATNPPTCPVT